MNEKQSLERRRRAIMEEVQARGYEAVVFFNEVIRQNPSNTIYVMPGALGDEQRGNIHQAGEGSPHQGDP